MTDILIKWVNEEIGLSVKVTLENSDIVFRNGYLYGEILSKLFNDASLNNAFLKNSIPQAMIQNYVSIEKIMSIRLGKKMSTQMVMEVVKGVEGSGFKMLYMIKSAFERARMLAKEDGRMPAFMDEAGKRIFVQKDLEHFATILKMQIKRFIESKNNDVGYKSPKRDGSPIRRYFVVPDIMKQEAPAAPQTQENIVPKPNLFQEQAYMAARKAQHTYEAAFQARHLKRASKMLRNEAKLRNKKQIDRFEENFSKMKKQLPVVETNLLSNLTKNSAEIKNICANQSIHQSQLEVTLEKKKQIDDQRKELEEKYINRAESRELQVQCLETEQVQKDKKLIEHQKNEEFCKTIASQIVDNAWKLLFNKNVSLGESSHYSESMFRKLQFDLGYTLSNTFNPIDAADEGEILFDKLSQDLILQFIQGTGPWQDGSVPPTNSNNGGGTAGANATASATAATGVVGGNMPQQLTVNNAATVQSSYNSVTPNGGGADSPTPNRLQQIMEDLFSRCIAQMKSSPHLTIDFKDKEENQKQQVINHQNMIMLVYDAPFSMKARIDSFKKSETIMILVAEELINDLIHTKSPKSLYMSAVKSLNRGEGIGDEVLVQVFSEKIKENPNKRIVLFDFPKTEKQAELLEKAFWDYKIPDNPQPGLVKRFKYDIPTISNNKSLLLPSVTMHTKIPTHRSTIMKVYCVDPSIYEKILVKKELGRLPFSFFDKNFQDKFNLANYRHLTSEMHTFYKGFCDFEVWNQPNKMWSNVVSFRKPLIQVSEYFELTEPQSELHSNYYLKDVSFYLTNSWLLLESTYVQRIKIELSRTHQEMDEFDQYVYSLKHDFLGTLNQPNLLEDILNQFLVSFNRIDQDARADLEGKNELHLRLQALIEQLVQECNRILIESEELAQTYFEDCWIEEKMCVLANIHLLMIKAEADRFVACQRILQDYYRDTIDKPTEITLLPEYIPFKPAKTADVFTSLTKTWRTTPSNSRIDLNIFLKSTKPASGGANLSFGQNLLASVPRRLSVSNQSLRPKPVEGDIPYMDDIQQAIEATTKMIGLADTSKDNKKKPATEANFDTPLEQQQAIEQEFAILKDRLKRIKNHYVDLVKLLRNKFYNLFSLTEDELYVANTLFHQLIGNVLSIIGSCIENEIGLPNSFVIQDKVVYLNYAELIYPPIEREAIEKIARDEAAKKREEDLQNKIKECIKALANGQSLPTRLEKERSKRYEFMFCSKKQIRI